VVWIVWLVLSWIPISLPGGKVKLLKTIHRWSALPAGIFMLFHLANSFAGIFSVELQQQMAEAFRKVYRMLPVEIVLTASFISLPLTGIYIASKFFPKATSRKALISAASGVHMAVFIATHLTAVFFLGRYFYKTDTNFVWAAGGEAGLLFTPGYTHLIPYYFLAVVAFFLHLGWAIVPALRPSGDKESTARVATLISVAGVVVGIIVLLSMNNIHLG
jgi:uncharacterized membrane protein YozB (DUF420 family)